MEFFDKIDTSIIAAIIAAIGTLLSAFISTFIKRLKRIDLKGFEIEFELEGVDRDPIHDSRLKDVIEVLYQQETNAKWYSRADGLLIIGQYIIGGLLASSFIQETFTPKLIGVLGILVLLSSLIRQRFRPDLKANGSKNNIVILRDLIRKVEDDIYAIKNGLNNAPSIIDVRMKVSKVLNSIEKSELEDLNQKIMSDAQSD